MKKISALSLREPDTFCWDDSDDVCFVLDQHVKLHFYSSFLAHWNKSAGRHAAPLLTHYSDFEPTSLCSYSLMLHA